MTRENGGAAYGGGGGGGGGGRGVGMVCIYHVADSDGKGSGAIVRTVYPGIELMGLNHDMEIPYDEIRKHEKVVVCDFALPVDFMFELNEKIDFTWIDHHASVINEYNEKLASGKYKEIK